MEQEQKPKQLTILEAQERLNHWVEDPPTETRDALVTAALRLAEFEDDATYDVLIRAAGEYHAETRRMVQTVIGSMGAPWELCDVVRLLKRAKQVTCRSHRTGSSESDRTSRRLTAPPVAR